MWRETTRQERNRRIWQEELDGFVPSRVIDFHVHVVNRATMATWTSFSCGGHDISEYDFENLRRDLADVFPGRQASAVCFGLPFPEFNEEANNAYVAAGCDRKSLFALRLYDPTEDAGAVRDDVLARGFVGLKPYPNYVRKADINQVEIREMLPDAILRVADELGLIIMLHIPRKGRLADPLNQRQIVEICDAFPRAKIVLAHIGRAYYLKNVVGHLERLGDPANLYYDTAMLNHAEVIEHMFRTVAPHKVLFGSDIPIALAPGKSVEINDQYTYVTPVPWELSICDSHKKIVFTSFLYEELRAIRKAVERADLPRPFVEGFFHDNAAALLAAGKR